MSTKLRSDFAPAVVNVIAHWPASVVPVHELEPSVTVTLPLGAPPPGTLPVTLYFTVTAWPTTDGSGSSAVIAVVVMIPLTVCGSPADVLVSKVEFPKYVAVSVPVPGVARVIAQLASLTLAWQLCTP